MGQFRRRWLLLLKSFPNSSADFFQNQLFQKKKKLSGTLLECQTVWIQIRTDFMSALIWVQTVCKGYQQMANVAASKERAKHAYTSTCIQ